MLCDEFGITRRLPTNVPYIQTQCLKVTMQTNQMQFPLIADTNHSMEQYGEQWLVLVEQEHNKVSYTSNLIRRFRSIFPKF